MTYRGGRAGRCGAAQATALGQIRSIAPHVRQQERCADCGRSRPRQKGRTPFLTAISMLLIYQSYGGSASTIGVDGLREPVCCPES
jgi:hypothetical protein